MFRTCGTSRPRTDLIISRRNIGLAPTSVKSFCFNPKHELGLGVLPRLYLTGHNRATTGVKDKKRVAGPPLKVSSMVHFRLAVQLPPKPHTLSHRLPPPDFRS